MRSKGIVFLLLCAVHASSSWAMRINLVTEHLPPFQIHSPQGISGFATDIVKATAEHAKIAYQIEAMTWSRAYHLAQRDKDTCIYSIAKGASRESQFRWIGKISYSLTSIYSLAERNDIVINTLEDAKKYTIAVTKDDITHHFLLKNGFVEGKQLYVIENVYGMLNLVKNRKDIDLIIVNDTILKYRAAESGIAEATLHKHIDLPELPLDFYLACNPNTSTEISDRLTNSLESIKKNGEFQRIMARWQRQLHPK